MGEDESEQFEESIPYEYPKYDCWVEDKEIDTPINERDIFGWEGPD